MKEINVHGKIYNVKDDEFEVVENEKLSPMVIRKDLGICDREIALLKKLSSTLGLNELFCSSVKFGGYIPINLINYFEIININCEKESVENINVNLSKYDKTNKIRKIRYNIDSVQYELSFENEIGIVISSKESELDGMTKVLYFDKFMYVSNLIWNKFNEKLKKYIIDDEFSKRFVYDNLINLMIMVKDAGDDFKKILNANKIFIDKLTILDTGSTDNTLETIREFLDSEVEGNLYEEPFINFRDSRNRLLELAGDECVFNIMIDDSYVLNGRLREFLIIARGDDEADSFSLFVSDPEIEYSSNRIIKSDRKLKYKYKIHEVIENNKNLCIPKSIAWIQDNMSEYMLTRTKNRKQNDVELLLREIEEDPDDPRHLYYLAESYYYLEDWENAFNYYKLRTEKEGFQEEIYDSLFKMSLISERHFKKSWEEVERMYMRCFEFDNSIPSPLFMIGYHYLNEGNNKTAYDYLKRVINMEKVHKNMNVRPVITNQYAPRFILPLCFSFEDYDLGLKCSQILLENYNLDFNAKKWNNIFSLFLQLKKEKEEKQSDVPKLKHDNNLICFVADGGWNNWDGETLRTKGLGGSETWTINYAETLALNSKNKVVVFCKCDDVKIYKDVTYLPIQNFIKFGFDNVIDVCIVSRFSEYLFLSNSEYFSVSKLYYVLHDITMEGEIIPLNKLDGVFCLTEWHKEQFLSLFPALKEKTNVISYGISVSDYEERKEEGDGRGYNFIYPSFPDRGLLYLLKMFPTIVEKYPGSKLNIFCDFDLEYLKNMKETMDEIKSLIEKQSENVTNHGWVNRETLDRYWSEADIWFYPCVFPETFCRVALEAAASKTFVISNGIAGLNETINKRGAIIPGNPVEEGWQKLALSNLFFVLDNKLENVFVDRNYEWAQTKTHENVVREFERFLEM